MPGHDPTIEPARFDCACAYFFLPSRYDRPTALEIDMQQCADHDTVNRRYILRIVLAAAAGTIGFIPATGQAESKLRRRIALDIRKRAVVAARNRTIRVNEGDDVRIDWTTDETADLHLHGYDIQTRVAPGRTASMTFRAHTAGRFPVSAHNFGHRMLLYLEVYPR